MLHSYKYFILRKKVKGRGRQDKKEWGIKERESEVKENRRKRRRRRT